MPFHCYNFIIGNLQKNVLGAILANNTTKIIGFDNYESAYEIALLSIANTI